MECITDTPDAFLLGDVWCLNPYYNGMYYRQFVFQAVASKYAKRIEIHENFYLSCKVMIFEHTFKRVSSFSPFFVFFVASKNAKIYEIPENFLLTIFLNS